jgi:hypothetical protein
VLDDSARYLQEEDTIQEWGNDCLVAPNLVRLARRRCLLDFSTVAARNSYASERSCSVGVNLWC